MIEKMKKITIVCLNSERERAVQAMEKLASIHVMPVQIPVSEEIDSLVSLQNQTKNAVTFLENLKEKIEPGGDGRRAESEKVQDILKKIADKKALQEKTVQLTQAIQELEPWGQFSEDSLMQLKKHGWNYALCVCGRDRVPEMPEGAIMQNVVQSKEKLWFLVLSQNSLEEAELPLAKFPMGMDMAALKNKMQQTASEIQKTEGELREAAQKDISSFRELLNHLDRRIEFARARDGMGQDGGQLAYLEGYVPNQAFDKVLQTAQKEGWAILYEDADRNDENVPTKLDIPRPFRMAQQIFDFIGVVPSYNETDVSIPMLIFLSIFCGMLIGDAGYGLLFTLLGLFFFTRTKAGRDRDGILLLVIMSASVLIFGALSGNWLGIEKTRLPLFMQGIPWLRDDANGDHLKLLCFFLGVFHLTLARIWAAAISGNVRAALGHIGWGGFLWGNFFTVKMLLVTGGALGKPVIGLYIVSTVLILTCGVNWKDMGEVIYLPFNFINSLVDVLSYIRLYAVGLASFYIANNFNSMSKLVWDISPWCIPVAILVILVGHGLNIASAAMGVLVHGIRLNTLEFSGHLGLGWAGKAYRAFGMTKK